MRRPTVEFRLYPEQLSAATLHETWKANSKAPLTLAPMPVGRAEALLDWFETSGHGRCEISSVNNDGATVRLS
jgi:hypothetical protein